PQVGAVLELEREGAPPGLRPRLRAFPAPVRAALAACRDAVGRRAADGRDGTGTDVPPAAPAHGRAVDGTCARARRAQLRDHPAGTRVGRRHARGRAECEHGALDRGSRLRPLDRPGRPAGLGRRAAPERGATEGVPWALREVAVAIRDLAALPARCRHRFPIFERQVYVNSCSQGALSDAVRAAYDGYLRDWDDEGAPWEYWVG